MKLPDDYDPEVEQGRFIDANEIQLRQILLMLPKMKSEEMDLLMSWISAEDPYGYWWKEQHATGVEWFIGFLEGFE